MCGVCYCVGLLTAVCANINLFMEVNEEEFEKYLQTFVTDVWHLLMQVRALQQDCKLLASSRNGGCMYGGCICVVPYHEPHLVHREGQKCARGLASSTAACKPWSKQCCHIKSVGKAPSRLWWCAHGPAL